MACGPLQVIAFGFGADLDVEERVIAELDRLEGRGVVRLLDMLFVGKAADGTVHALDVGDDDEYGTLLTSLLGSPGELSDEQADAGLLEIAEDLDTDSAMAILLIEHVWACGLFDAIGDAGGFLLAEGMLTDDAGVLMGAEVDAMNDAAEAIAAAQAVEAAATLEALQVVAEAEDAIQKAEAIKAAAAASAVQALMEAGIIREAAAHEAAEALAAAGLIEAAAMDDARASIETAAIIEAAAESQAAEVVEAAAEVEAEAVAEALLVEAAAEQVEEEAVAEAAAVVESVEELEQEAALDAAAAMEASLAAEVEASLTKAERRVLDYLPTELSFQMIGDRLHISASAARDRASRVYEKLGVHSRGEAVERLKQLGLV